MSKKKQGPKILILDIETIPLTAYTWGLFDQNIALNQIKDEWAILSFAAKWLDDKHIFYMDQRKEKNIRNDKKLLKALWKLMDESDIILTQNGISFDIKKINARFLLNGMNPPSPSRQIDTLRIMRKNFALTSNKLEFATKALCKKYKKLTNRKYSGFTLWSECMKGNQSAFKELEVYNKYDILSLQELYVDHLRKWDTSINFSVYNDSNKPVCSCGSTKIHKHQIYTNNIGRFQKYKCQNCGSVFKGGPNLLSKEKKKSLLKKL